MPASAVAVALPRNRPLILVFRSSFQTPVYVAYMHFLNSNSLVRIPQCTTMDPATMFQARQEEATVGRSAPRVFHPSSKHSQVRASVAREEDLPMSSHSLPRSVPNRHSDTSLYLFFRPRLCTLFQLAPCNHNHSHSRFKWSEARWTWLSIRISVRRASLQLPWRSSHTNARVVQRYAEA